MKKKILSALLGIALALSSSILVFASIRPYVFILSCTTYSTWIDPNSDPDYLVWLYDYYEALFCGNGGGGDNNL